VLLESLDAQGALIGVLIELEGRDRSTIVLSGQTLQRALIGS